MTACKFRALRSIAVEMTALAAPAFCAAFGAATPAAGAPRAVLAGASPAAASPSARDQVDLVTWVPGHRDRSLERGFNQAELLARGLARAAGVPCAALLRRTRHGVRQSGLDRVARTANVRDAFALREDASRVLRNLKRVVVVDDVYTTGETLNHCARVLRHAGIDPLVFTFARTVRAHPSRNTSNRPAPPREATPSRASLHTATDKERCR